MKEKKQVKKSSRKFKAVAWLLLMAIVFSLTPNAAIERKTAGKFYGTKWNYNTKTKTLTLSCKGKMDDFRVVGSHENVDWPWAVWGYEMEKIVVKEGVTYLGSSVADGYSKVKSVSLPKSLKIIGHGAFSFTSITTVKLPSNIKTIKEYAFSSSKIKKINLPENATDLKDYVFLNCKKLTKVQLPKKLDKISDGLLCYCSKLKTITIPPNVTQIGEEAFYQSGLTTITIPKKVTRIKAEAFKKCTSLKKVTFKTSKLTTIESSLFEGCKKLTAITLPGSITKLRKRAFKGSGLIAITIPEQVTMIDEDAFLNCKGLKEVTFAGSQLTSIGRNAFRNVPSDCIFKVPAGQAENVKALLMASGLGDTVTVTEY